MLPESQAKNLLHARVATIEEIMGEFQRKFKAHPVLNADATYLSAEQEFATRLSDLRMETLASIKRIEATRGKQ